MAVREMNPGAGDSPDFDSSAICYDGDKVHCTNVNVQRLCKGTLKSHVAKFWSMSNNYRSTANIKFHLSSRNHGFVHFLGVGNSSLLKGISSVTTIRTRDSSHSHAQSAGNVLRGRLIGKFTCAYILVSFDRMMRIVFR